MNPMMAPLKGKPKKKRVVKPLFIPMPTEPIKVPEPVKVPA